MPIGHRVWHLPVRSLAFTLVAVALFAAPSRAIAAPVRDEQGAPHDAKAERMEHEKAERATLRARYGELADSRAFRSELRRHERRLARLHRLDEKARAKKDEAKQRRVASLVAKENARHVTRVADLKTRGVSKP